MPNIVRGDDEFWFIQLMEADGVTPYDLASCTVSVTAKLAYDDDLTDAAARYQHWITFDGAGLVTASSGMDLGGTDPETPFTVYTLASEGVVTQHLSAAESADLTAVTHTWEIQLKDAAGNIHTIASGTEETELDLGRKTAFA